MSLRGKNGFSLVEGIIVIAIIVGLAGVVVPIVSQEVKDSKKSQALADINRLATGLNQYIKDTLYFPTGKEGATTFHFLYTDGNAPDNNLFATGESSHIKSFLVENRCGGNRWKGPYLNGLPCDPWGNAYLVNVQGFYNQSERAMILSAGPDGVVDTPARAASPAGDDLMMLID